MFDEIPQIWYEGTASGVAGNDARLPDQSRRRRAFMAKDQVAPEGGDSQFVSREIWKPVPSEPGVHASSWGRILQRPGYAPLPNGGFRLYTPKPRFGQVAKSNKAAAHKYRNIMLRRWGDGPRQSPRKVHQLVCEAFHGPKPFPDAVVIHIDEDALNNRPENLRWWTQKENLNMPKFKEYSRNRTGENSPVVKGRIGRKSCA